MSAFPTASEIAHKRADRPKQSRKGGFLVPCWGHADTEPSLEIWDAPDGPAFKCYGGCDDPWLREAAVEQGILPALRPSKRVRSKKPQERLTLEGLAVAKGLPETYLLDLGLTQGTGREAGAVLIPYRDEEGREVLTRIRRAVKASGGSRWRGGAEPLALHISRARHRRAAVRR
ncbi:MAG: hypothetical protein ACYSWU_17065 [Planctomycetota bacterium]|jgi:hypothetical protein